MPSFVLALDQGTTSSRALLFDRTGEVRGVAQKEFRQCYPRPGWVEHDPEEIWSTQEAVALEVLGTAGIDASEIAAIGITNQRETTLVWDRRTGRPVYPAIVWQDRRTAGICERLTQEGRLDIFQSRTGLVLDAYFSGPKVKWILDNVEGARGAADKGELAFGTVDSWLLWKLTGGKSHLTDITNASRTLLFDIHKKQWSEELAGLLNVPVSMLPKVCPSSGDIAKVACGSPLDGMAVRGLAGDQQAALFGQACFESGTAKNTYGTGCFVLMNTGESAVRSQNRLVTTVAWQVDGKTEYALEGSIFIGGAVVQWLRDELGLIDTAADIEGLAKQARDNGGVYFVPAFVGLGAPHWDPYARGTILGLTRGSGAAHIARAAIEAIAFQSVDVLEAMEADSGIRLKELRVDGGASKNNLLMQIQADLLQVPVRRPKVTETTAFGAACLAGLAAGVWSSREDIAGRWVEDRLFTPVRSGEDRDRLRQGWTTALARAGNWVMDSGS